jgi:hypothetical protein
VTIIRRGNAWLSNEDGLLWVEGVCGRLHIFASFGGKLACAGEDPQYSDKPVIEGARPKWCGEGRSREEDVGNGFERFQRSFLSAEGYLR